MWRETIHCWHDNMLENHWHPKSSTFWGGIWIPKIDQENMWSTGGWMFHVCTASILGGNFLKWWCSQITFCKTIGRKNATALLWIMEAMGSTSHGPVNSLPMSLHARAASSQKTCHYFILLSPKWKGQLDSPLNWRSNLDFSTLLDPSILCWVLLKTI